MGRELRYAVESKVQLRNSLAAAEGKTRALLPTLRSRTGCHPTCDWSVCCAENNVAAARKQQKKQNKTRRGNEQGREKEGKKRSDGRPEEQGRIVLAEAEQEILCYHTPVWRDVRRLEGRFKISTS